jgi:hypothetical protein
MSLATEVQDVLAKMTSIIGSAIKLAENPNVEAAVAKIIPAIEELATPGEQIQGIVKFGSAIIDGVLGAVEDNNPTFKALIDDVEGFIATIIKDLQALIPAGDPAAADANFGKLG